MPRLQTTPVQKRFKPRCRASFREMINVSFGISVPQRLA
jgi:hypothetical protein